MKLLRVCENLLSFKKIYKRTTFRLVSYMRPFDFDAIYSINRLREKERKQKIDYRKRKRCFELFYFGSIYTQNTILFVSILFLFFCHLIVLRAYTAQMQKTLIHSRNATTYKVSLKPPSYMKCSQRFMLHPKRTQK